MLNAGYDIIANDLTTADPDILTAIKICNFQLQTNFSPVKLMLFSVTSKSQANSSVSTSSGFYSGQCSGVHHGLFMFTQLPPKNTQRLTAVILPT